MSQKRIKGQNLTEFAIIIALIAIAGILALVFLGDEVKKMFGISSNKYSSYKPFEFGATGGTTTLPGGTLKAGSLGGTSDKPVSQCDGGICTIDFGEMILTDIPEGFNNYVENFGASGGTDKISALLLQIAQQLEAQGKLTEAELIKKMAVTGHNIAATEKVIEDRVKTCNKDEACIKKVYATNFNEFKEIQNVDTTYYPFEMDYAQAGNKVWTTSIGFMVETQKNNPEAWQKQLSYNAPAAVYLRDYQEVMSNDNISEVTKNILKELTWSLGTTSDDFRANFQHYTDGVDDQIYYDPLTGDCRHISELGPEKQSEDFFNYKASQIVHLDSSLICASANAEDTGVKCH